jgi:hypothetical protein
MARLSRLNVRLGVVAEAVVAEELGTDRTGTITSALTGITQSSVGEVESTSRTGTATNTLTGISQSSTAYVELTGTATNTLSGISQSSTAYVELTGTASQALGGLGQSATAEIIPSAASILSVVPSTFANDAADVVITVSNIVTAGAVVRIDGVEQSITGSDSTTITITTVQGNRPDGAGLLEVIAA